MNDRQVGKRVRVRVACEAIAAFERGRAAERPKSDGGWRDGWREYRPVFRDGGGVYGPFED